MLPFFPMLLASWLALSPNFALGVSNANIIEKMESILKRQASSLESPFSTATSAATATTSGLSTATTSTCAATISAVGEPVVFVIPTISNNTQAPQIKDPYQLGGYRKVYSIHYGVDYPQFGNNAGVTDVSHEPQPDFSLCLQSCAMMDIGNEGDVNTFTGCTGVSWVNNRCFLKLGLRSESIVPSFNPDAISAILHFLG